MAIFTFTVFQGVGFLAFSLLSMLVMWSQIHVFGQYCGCNIRNIMVVRY